MDNREKLAEDVTALARSAGNTPEREVLYYLAEHLSETAGEFSDKALAEIAYAYLAGQRDATFGLPGHRDLADAVKKAQRLVARCSPRTSTGCRDDPLLLDPSSHQGSR